MRVPRKPPACPDCKHPKRDHVMWFDYVERRQVVGCTVTSCQCKIGQVATDQLHGRLA